ncbi:MAG TPA: 3-oxoacyl-[acyl-carrier-protein] reductase [Firmicutes bacterium]|nr:3-oxoacyl-[acyl-carrier-protein] reductase [Bacillota bacterium]
MVQGRVALVTGGTRGIGLAISEEFVKAGARVAILGSNPENVDTAVKKLNQLSGNRVLGVVANVGELSEVLAGVKVIESNLGTVEILVNNAGITRDALFMRMTEENWDNVINVNLKGVFNCTKAVFRPMVKNRFGKIINITSVVGLSGNMGQANYAASKAGVIGFTKTIAKEGAPFNIICNAVAPGFIDTQMTKDLPDKVIEEIRANIPLAKLGKPEDVAKVVAFLASDVNQYITGQIISVDGGMNM